MSLCLGMLLPKSYESKVSEIRKKYDLYLMPVANQSIISQFNEKTFFQVSQFGDDSNTGIGSYKFFKIDVNALEEASKGSQFILQDFKKRKENYIKDAEKWVEIISFMLVKMKITSVSIFYYNGHYEPPEKQKFTFTHQSECKLDYLTSNYLINMKENELATFIL